MRVRALDGDHDWTFGKGQNDYLRDQKACIQNINTRLNCFLGDCFFDTGAGIDWFSYLGGSKDQGTLSLAMSAVILNTQDVTGLKRLSFTLADRSVTAVWRVQSTYSSPSGQFQLDLNGAQF